VALLRRIGSSIETPSLYGALTARENLEVWRRVFDCPAARIPLVLAQVGLGSTGTKRVGQFSLGMKQRLALAIALLHQPELLLLDEPTNGLDPHGILEMRDLLLRLNREDGTTIVVSSHLLSEVERLVGSVGIIDRGALRFQGPLAALVERQAASASTTLDTDDNRRAQTVLEAAGYAPRLDERLVLPRLERPELARLNATLVGAGIGVHHLTSTTRNLEEIFLDLIGAPQTTAEN
jgi:ABC-type multidrug transport system ATPase subunit